MAKPEPNSGSGKLIFIAVLLFLFVVAVLQNTQPVSLKFLFWSVSMPRAILILIAALVGLIFGIFLSVRAKKNRAAK
ncbi:MAG TPA: LapA family protein [candidate division Zixibacteria bacterium]|nr:LapA family protein [candidate division Zixibacteria bacterium]